MKRSYTLFIATSELLTCPAIYQHAKTHTVILTPNTKRVLSVITPLEHPPGDLREASVNYDPHMVVVDSVDLMYEKGLLYGTFTIRAVDVGATQLTLTLPAATEFPSTVLSAAIS